MNDLLTGASNLSVKDTVNIAFEAGYRRALVDVFNILNGVELNFHAQVLLHQLEPPPLLPIPEKDVPNG